MLNNKKTIIFDAIINNKTICNFMFQLKIQKLNFSFFIEINIKLYTMNDILLHVYKKHNVHVNVINANKKTKKFIQSIITINIKNVDII